MKGRKPAVTTLALLVAVTTGWATYRHHAAEATEQTRHTLAELSKIRPGVDQRDFAIALFEQRVERDPYSTVDWSWLAGTLIQRGRETGNGADFVRAEEAARRSLQLGEDHNTATLQTLGASLLDQHRFADARAVAEVLVELEPDNAPYRAFLGEIQLETGDYSAARTTFGALQSWRTDFAVAPVLARWAEVDGRPADAVELLRPLRDQANARLDLGRGEAAWFYLRLGTLAFEQGQAKQAEQEWQDGLAIRPNDYRILAALARLEAGRGNWQRATELGERAIAEVLDPATLGLLSEVAAAQGDAAKAEEYAAVMEVSVSGQPGVLHRQWALFLLDRDRRVDEVAAQAAAEVRSRPDVFTYDLLAWARYKQGRFAEAQSALTSAQRLGTRDAEMHFHAGMIQRALGNREAAREALRAALDINPYFHPTHPATARAVLRSLQTEVWRARFPF